MNSKERSGSKFFEMKHVGRKDQSLQKSRWSSRKAWVWVWRKVKGKAGKRWDFYLIICKKRKMVALDRRKAPESARARERKWKRKRTTCISPIKTMTFTYLETLKMEYNAGKYLNKYLHNYTIFFIVLNKKIN